ncbi:hypothetical protein GC197_17920 [bacterium]|nr:hypothetical protein [bacterium]
MRLPIFLATFVLLTFAQGAQADPRVTLEVVTEKGISITALQSWNQLLNGKGADSVTVRPGRDGDKVGIEESNIGSSKSYRVKAILSRKETLNMPDGKVFTKSTIGSLPAWFQKLKVGGEDELNRQPGRGGMTRNERSDVMEKLSKPLTFSTKGQPMAELLGSVRELTGLNFEASSAMVAKVKLLSAEDEVKGFSAGTAMAILLRAHGLIVVPKREVGGEVILHILEMGQSDEAWPIGQPLRRSPADLCPVMFQFIEVEINGTPLMKAVDAIQPRLKTEIFFDHYKIAQDKIDTDINVRYPKARTFYKKILDHILYQAFLSIDLTADEAGKPFLWVTSAKRG